MSPDFMVGLALGFLFALVGALVGAIIACAWRRAPSRSDAVARVLAEWEADDSTKIASPALVAAVVALRAHQGGGA